MPSERTESALRDILHYAKLAQNFIVDMNFDSFHGDDRTILATTRCLEVISEASRRLPDAVKARHPHIEWRRMAAAGNIYRHQYDNVEIELVWETLHKALPPLREAIEAELSRS